MITMITIYVLLLMVSDVVKIWCAVIICTRKCVNVFGTCWICV